MKIYILMVEKFQAWEIDSVYKTKESAIIEVANRKEKNNLLRFEIIERTLKD